MIRHDEPLPMTVQWPRCVMCSAKLDANGSCPNQKKSAKRDDLHPTAVRQG